MYTIKEAAHRAGVSVPLLRAWERRYGVVRPARTASGYRLYDDEAIARLRAMQRLIESGWTASQAALNLQTAGVSELENPGTSTSQPADAGADPFADSLIRTFVEAAARLDERAVDAVVDELFASASFERSVDQRVMPALRALGDAWAAGALSVGGEHMASHAVLRRLSAAFEAAGQGPGGGPVIVGLPPGSRHEIGALAFATVVRRRGLPVVYLGADVPLASWRVAVAASAGRAAIIAVPTDKDRAQAAGVTRALLEGAYGVLVAIGGPGATRTTVPDAVTRLPDGMRASIVALEAALGTSSTA
jgi:DNA-binding transcriptional MerR regulator